MCTAPAPSRGPLHGPCHARCCPPFPPPPPPPLTRCCDKFLFTVHPVFGAFYNIRIPLLDETQEEDELGETPFFTRNICFRRKFHTKPKVKAFTPESVRMGRGGGGGWWEGNKGGDISG